MTTVALVGCGHIHTPGFVNRLAARADVTVKTVWDHDMERAQGHAETLGATAVTNPHTIWQDNDINAAIICSETNKHEAFVLPAAAAGKHLFVEKPLGMAAADARKMAAAINEAGIIFQTGYFQRGYATNQFLRQQIQLGHFGQITRLRLSNCHSGALGDWFTPKWLWMTDPAVAGVGAFGDLGTHALDLLLWFMGPEVERVTAVLRTALARYGEKCDEYGEGMLQFRSGAIATLAAGWVDVADPVTVQIAGTEGHAAVVNGELFFKSSHVEGADGKSAWTDLPTLWPHAFELFLDAVGGNTDVPLVTADEAAQRSVVMGALYEAAQAGQWVDMG
ncbi:MAG: Gfo/Idh/MocA family oxidoreductase [Ardenticatenaceae bacterium]|nr:Gfo/Idh/MocA family oxidoreductase [Ardenticatenaceae bacterium]